MYKLTLTPTGSVLKTLYRFDKTHGFDPTALVQGTDGNFYGTTLGGGTLSGGPSINGVIFKMNPAGQLVWVHNFTGTDGQNPYGPIIQGSDGNLYGTTRNGGSSGFGVVYKITPAGVYKVLFNFNATSGPGTNPRAGAWYRQPTASSMAQRGLRRPGTVSYTRSLWLGSTPPLTPSLPLRAKIHLLPCSRTPMESSTVILPQAAPRVCVAAAESLTA